jgi:hypothetical protein
MAEKGLATAKSKLEQLPAVAEAERAVAMAKAELESATARVGVVELRSPVNGMVVSENPRSLMGKKVRNADVVLVVSADPSSR